MYQEIIGFKSARPMLLATKGAVGTKGENFAGDVLLVQSLLNNVPPSQGGPSPLLSVDGRCGPLTIAAIHKFQKVRLAGFSDGRVDARGKTIRHLVQSTIDSGKMVPQSPGLVPATRDDLAGVQSLVEFPFYRISRTEPIPIFAQNLTPSNLVTGINDTGFGAPFTSSGWTINNNAFSLDISGSTGGYIARLEIFQDKNPSIRTNVSIAGVFKSLSTGPFGADLGLPSMPSTQGKIIRGLIGFGPISPASFFGLCNFGLVGAAVFGGGVNATLFQFGWAPAPPGMCVGFAVMAGINISIPVPNAGIGGGTGLCIPV